LEPELGSIFLHYDWRMSLHKHNFHFLLSLKSAPISLKCYLGEVYCLQLTCLKHQRKMTNLYNPNHIVTIKGQRKCQQIQVKYINHKYNHSEPTQNGIYWLKVLRSHFMYTQV
jgi:hypothetical protein